MGIEQKITETLDKMGFKRSNKGFDYARSAVKKCVENPELICQTMKLYETVAYEHGTTYQNIERCIRHSILKAINPKPRTGEFLAKLADDIKIGGLH